MKFEKIENKEELEKLKEDIFKKIKENKKKINLEFIKIFDHDLHI